MCLIIHKDPNVEFDMEFIEDCIKNSSVKNDDGFGYAIHLGDKIKIRKGFKNEIDLIKSLKKLEKALLDDNEVAIHLRNSSPNTAETIATTHPIVSDSVLNTKTSFLMKKGVAVCHNGSFRDFKTYTYHHGKTECDNSSDTLKFVEEYFSGEGKDGYYLFDYIIKHHNKKLSEFTGYNNNKILIMSPNRETIKIGSWVKESGKDGYAFSNSDYDLTFKNRYTNTNSTKRGNGVSRNHNSYYGAGLFNNNDPIYDDLLEDSHETNTPKKDELKCDDVNVSDIMNSKSFIIPGKGDDLAKRFTVFHRKCSTKINETKLVYGKIPFSCHQNSNFDKNCPLLMSKGACCNAALLKTEDPKAIILRKEVGEVIRKQAYMNRDIFNQDDIDTLNFIKESKHVSIAWMACKFCQSRVRTFASCSHCDNLRSKLKFLLIKDFGTSKNLYISDAIKIQESRQEAFINPHAIIYEETVLASELFTKIVNAAKRRLANKSIPRVGAE